MTIRKTLQCLALASALSSCGVVDPKYEDYTVATVPTPADASTECGKEALDLFTAAFTETISGKGCLGCHAAGKSNAANVTLSGTSSDDDRSAIFALTLYDATTMLAVIRKSPDHPGSGSVELITDELVTAWTTKEQECSTATE